MGRSKPVSEGLWDRIVSFDNLWHAARLARKGKRMLESAGRFERNLGQNLTALQDELSSGTYRPGEYTTFTIYEPAKRMISAAPYRDRVVHHALCGVIEPLFEAGKVPTPHSSARRGLRGFSWGGLSAVLRRCGFAS